MPRASVYWNRAFRSDRLSISRERARGSESMNEQLTSTWAVLDEAHHALRSAVAGVKDGDWARPTPCAQWNVTQVLQHAAGDQLGYAAAITGTGWPAYDPFAPDGQLAGADPAAFVEETMRASAAA